MRAAEMAGTPRVFQATQNRDRINARRSQASEAFQVPDLGPDFGTPEAELTTAVDVSPYAEVKRAAMRAHASQISEQSFFLALPDELFELAFGTEWFIRVGAEPRHHRTRSDDGNRLTPARSGDGVTPGGPWR